SGQAALRGVAYTDKRGGYIDNPPRDAKDLNHSRRSGGRLAFAADLGGGWRLDADLAHQDISTYAAQYAQGPLGPLTRNTQVREATVTSAPGGLRWLAGLFATQTRERDTARLRFVNPVGEALTLYHRRDELAEEAVYGEATFDLTPKLTFTAGLRGFPARTST